MNQPGTTEVDFQTDNGIHVTGWIKFRLGEQLEMHDGQLRAPLIIEGWSLEGRKLEDENES